MHPETPACRRFRPFPILCLLSLLVCANDTAFAATFYVDATAGDDASAGSDRALAWRSWGKLLDEIDAGSVGAGDTVLVRPGRYRAHAGPTGFPLPWKIEGSAAGPVGGAAGAPLTVSVDTFYPGDVEITAALPGGYASAARQWTTPWADAALECTGVGTPWSCCSGAGTGCASIYRTDIDMVGRSKGVGPGACFQPGATPGAEPQMWETLYSPEGDAVDMPAFTPDRDQCWFYIETASHCLGAGDPWACCDAPASGPTCTENARVYARTASGASPATLAAPLEFPAGAIFEIGDVGEVAHVRLTNDGNGRRFHLRWGTSALLRFKIAHDIAVEDFTLGYNARIRSNDNLAFGKSARSGAGFPRNTQGSSYLVFVTENATAPQHHISFRRGVVEKGQGDEAFHIGSPVPQIGQSPATCTSVADCTETALGNAVMCADFADCDQGGLACCYYVAEDDFGSNVYEDLEIRDIPWQVANGTDFYGSGAYAWPPAPYSPAWDTPYQSHFNPLGGGGQTPGCTIDQQWNGRYTRVRCHSVDGDFRLETGSSATIGGIKNWPHGIVIEQSVFDGNGRTDGHGGPGSIRPYCATCVCQSPGDCGGFSNSEFIHLGTGSWDVDRPGVIFRNNVVKNCVGACLKSDGTAQGNGSAISPQIVNNTFHLLGDAGTQGPPNNPRISFQGKWGTPSGPLAFKNNIIVNQDADSTVTVLHVTPNAVANVDVDRNLYGPVNMRWQLAFNIPQTTLAGWQQESGHDATSPPVADPLFAAAPTDLHLAAGSPAIDAGLALAGVSADIDGEPRPQGLGPDIGADESAACATDADCNDANACTDDTCDAGACRYADNAAACDDGVACTQADACLSGTCAGSPVDTFCDDGAFCNGAETCDPLAGCVAGPAPSVDDGVACTIDSCDEATDGFVHMTDDSLCDDALACNGVETCDAVLDCMAGPPPCNDGVDCTQDACDEASGCTHTPDDAACDDGVSCTLDTCDEAAGGCTFTPADGDCDDGLFCNGAETCDALLGCLPGAAPDCDDTVACTVDACDEAADACSHIPDDAACDDGVACTVDACDAVAGCSVTANAASCDDGIGCTADTCDTATGCAHTPIDAVCEDGVPCTADACDAVAGGCTFTPADGDCDDGLFCNGAETCDALLGCVPGAAPDCDDTVACTVDACDATTDTCSHAPDDTACDDGLACTTDLCDAAAGCASTPLDTACDDGLVCNGVETCDDTLGCAAGAAPDCDDGLSCTLDTCDETAGGCASTPADGDCDDGLFCNGAETCDALLGCLPGAAPDCDDTVACTVDACDATTDTCSHAPVDTACDDGVGCTADRCSDGLTGCVNTPIDAVCDDGLFCNGAETCDAIAACVAGRAPDCDDGIACTLDTCDVATDSCASTGGCIGRDTCNTSSGLCEPADPRVWIAAATDPGAEYAGAMTTSTSLALGDDADPAADSIVGALVYAASNTNAFGGGSGDAVTYVVDLPESGAWYVWARLYYPGAPGSNQANSFLLSVDGGAPSKLGNNRDFFQQWHWDGDGLVETGAPTALSLGFLVAGRHALTVEKREVTPIQPRLDVIVLTPHAQPAPTDAEAAIALFPFTTTTLDPFTTTTLDPFTTTTLAPITTTTLAPITTTTLAPITTTTLPPAGPVRPRDWTPAFSAVWRFEEVAGDALDELDARNDLFESGGVGRDSVFRIEGERSALLAADDDQYLSCTSCAAPRDAGPATFGCWIRPDTLGSRLIDSWLDPGGVQWQLLDQGGLRCNIGDGAGTKAHNVPSGTIAPGQWAHAVCQSDVGAIRQFVAGTAIGSDKPHGVLAPTSAPLRLSTNNKGADYSGRLDECFWIDAAMDAARICRICSCGIDGTAGPCACDPGDPTLYLDEGRNDSLCGGCELAGLACDARFDRFATGTTTSSTMPATTTTLLPTTTLPAGCETDADCDDGLFCTGVESCIDATCQAGTPPSCEDGVVCTGDACDPLVDGCIAIPVDSICDDLDPCNGLEVCAVGIGCLAGVTTDCDDANECTDDSCDAVTGCVSIANHAPCDDGISCTAADVCSGGVCAGIDACPAGSSCSPTLGLCAQGPGVLWIAAASDPTGVLAGAMTTSVQFALGDDADGAADSLVGELVYADSVTAAFSGGSGDEVAYTVDLPEAGTWYLWARLYYPGAVGSNEANSFLVSVDGAQKLKLGNNRDWFQLWHWDGDGSVESGATSALSLGTLQAGPHVLTVEKREVSPVAPRIDVLVLTSDPGFVPDDLAAAAALGVSP